MWQLTRVKVLVLSAFSILLFQNCGGFDRAANVSFKTSVIASTGYFAASTTPVVIDGKCYLTTEVGVKEEVPCDGPTPTPTPCPTCPTPTPTPPGATPTPTPMPTPPPVVTSQFPVDLFCSVDGATKIGTTLKASAPDMVYEFKTDTGEAVCTTSETGAKDAIINTGKIAIANLAGKCPNLVSGTYTMTMKPIGWSGASLLMTINLGGNLADPQGWIGHPFKIKVDKQVAGITLTAASKAPCETWGLNERFFDDAQCVALYGALPGKVLLEANSTYANTQAFGDCDRAVSPLVVQLGDGSPIRLTAPLDGVRFDIMGVNSQPAYAPKQISWFDETSAADNYFIVLPNRGQVRGIDQLFGDNTMGPDGKTAANGYAALRKWDGRLANGSIDRGSRDGLISEEDAVYASLRLWADANRDGIAQSQELFTLKEKGVVYIDLAFDPDYKETDEFGNEIRMKSVIETADGKLHRVFDIWFRAID